MSNHLTLTILWDDPDVIEIASCFRFGEWSGYTTAYAGRTSLAEFAEQLASFATSLEGSAEFEAGRDDGIGYLYLRFYPLDSHGHLGCLLRTSTKEPTNNPRAEQITRVSIELRTETAALDNLVRQLRHIGETLSGTAVLALS